MPQRDAMSELAGREWEAVSLSPGDFQAGADEGSTISAGQIGEVLEAVVGQSNRDDSGNDLNSSFDSYDRVWLGQETAPDLKGPRGKIYGLLRNGVPEDLPPETEVRAIARPKNKNKRTALTPWIKHRDLDQSTPSERLDLGPIRNERGDPLIVREGRVIAIEVRNTSSDVTVSKENSDFDIPALMGY